MKNNALKEAVLSSIADLFIGLSAAWIFVGYAALPNFVDLIYSLSLAILSFSTAIYLRYVKLTRSH
jgi:hypothetical protein